MIVRDSRGMTVTKSKILMNAYDACITFQVLR